MTILRGEWIGNGEAQGRRRISRNLQTVARAVVRYGWRNLIARTAGALRSGGPALLLQKFRQQRALGHFQVAPEIRTSNPVRAAAFHLPATGDTFHLCEDFSLPTSEFIRFMSRWYEHPAIMFLTAGATAREMGFMIVVARHPEDGFGRLRDTLDFAAHLARRIRQAVRVAVYTDAEEALPEDFTEACGLLALSVVRTTRELCGAILDTGRDSPVQFLVSGDQICPVFSEVLGRSRLDDFDLVLTDAYFQESDQATHLVLLPGIDPIHALNADYFLSRAILRSGLAAEILAGQSLFDPHTLIVSAMLRRVASGSETRMRHVAFPMLRIAETRAMIERRRLAVLARSSPLRLPSAARTSLGPVSVVICTRDNGFLLDQLVEGLERTASANLADIVVVSNRTVDPHATAVHDRLAAAGRIKLLRYDEPFNFSAQSNLGAAASVGDVLLFLNDDVVPMNSTWFRELIAPLEDPAIGVVGPLLFYPDQTVQHAGMYLGHNRLAGHALRGVRLPQGDCGFLATAPRRVMAVTGAALAMRRADFEVLGGFDRTLFALHIQDVDLCLRAHFSGLAVVYNPRAVLLHMESVSVRPTLSDPWIAQRRTLEHAAFLRRWGEVLGRDPFMNPNILPIAENLRTLQWPPGASAS
jgi:GT2 family glycosyltransferase